MKKIILKAEDRTFLCQVADLVYCNPFLPERIEKEAKALGLSKADPSSFWNLPKHRKQDHVLRHILEKTSHILKNLEAGKWTQLAHKEEQDAACNAFYFLTFHECLQDLDILVCDHGELPKGFLEKYKKTYHTFFNQDAENLKRNHVLALFYQMRRAYNFTSQLIFGNSSTAMRLRATIWESVFTHDLRGYIHSVYADMTQIPVLIIGPSGSGKDLVAQVIGRSLYIPFDEATQKFVYTGDKGHIPVCLNALSRTLVESELFGHMKGAFTGADKERKGFLNECGEYGCVFLDEIGEIDASIQVKLLRLLQNRSFFPIGSTQAVQFYGKIIAATNRDLRDEVEQGRFRADLLYRLAADTLHTPSLKQILEEDPKELEFLVEHAAEKIVGSSACDDLKSTHFNGYVSTLENPTHGQATSENLNNACAVCSYTEIIARYSAIPLFKAGSENHFQSLAQEKLTLDEVSRRYIQAVYGQLKNYEKTAEALGIDWRTVKTKVLHE